jgi:zinc transport system ATP-binding protein
MTESALIRLTHAGYQTADRWLVKDVSLSVDHGQIVTLIGPNGSGKSTTAKLALGILKPTSGSSYRSPGLRVSYVPQKLSIDWTLPLNVDQFLRLTEKPAAEARTHAIEATGIGNLLKQELRLLSGGEFQRVLIARAIARKPDLLVLDEPVQGVDFSGENELYQLIGEIRDDLNCGVLMISHDLHVVMAKTDQVLCLNGHVCCSGTPITVSQTAEFQALFGLRGNADIALYQHHHDHHHAPDGSIAHEHHEGCSHDR